MAHPDRSTFEDGFSELSSDVFELIEQRVECRPVDERIDIVWLGGLGECGV
jgi:hypothetical protein